MSRPSDNHPATATFKLAAGTLNLDLKVFTTGEHTISLTTREYDVLRYLIRRRGDRVAREEITASVWPAQPEISPRSIDQVIKRLRQKIERDPSNPEHLFSVYGEGYRFTLDGLLQPDPTHDVGSLYRRSQAIDIWTRLHTCDDRALTITGRGGMGKSALVTWISNHWPTSRCVFLDVESAANWQELSVSLAARIGLDTASLTADDVQSEIYARLESSKNLLILDNATNLTSELRQVIPDLLENTTTLRIVVTARLPLSYPAEVVETIGGLAPNDACDLFRLRAESAGVSGERIKSLDAIELKHMLKRLDYMPLAIEIVASQSAAVGFTELVDEVNSPSIGNLPGPRDLPPRQRTLWNTFQGSWTILSKTQQIAWVSCAAMVHEADGDFVEFILRDRTDQSAESSLASLVERHLLERIAYEGEPNGYRVPGLLRDFALAQLPRLEAEQEIRMQIRQHTETLALRYSALRTEPIEVGPNQRRRHASWLSNVMQEHDFSSSDAQAMYALAADNLVSQSTPAHLRLPNLNRALQNEPQSVHHVVLLQRAKAECIARCGQFAEGKKLLQDTSSLALEHCLHREFAWTLSNLGLCSMAMGDPLAADEYFSEARSHALEFAPDWALSPTINLAVLYTEQGRFDAAMQFIDEVSQSPSLSRHHHRHLVALLRARVLRDLSEDVDLESEFLEAARLFRELGDMRECIVHGEWALHNLQQGQIVDGLDKLDQCITTCEELQLHAHKAKMLSYRGLAHLVANSPSKAVSDAEQCLVIANRIGSVEAEPLALAVVAAVHAIRGSRESASEAWNAASSRLTMQMGARMRPILRAISPAIYDSPQSSTRHDHFAEASQSPSAQLRLMRRALSRYYS